MLDRRLEPHDANQLELKLAYLLRPGQRQSYRVETFMFIPRSLGLDGYTYGAERFYEDTSVFVRLKTPRVPIGILARAGQSDEWFGPIRDALKTPVPLRPRQATRLASRLKLLGCIYRSSLRDVLIRVGDQFAQLPPIDTGLAGVRERELAGSIVELVAEVRRALDRLRELGHGAERDDVPAQVRETWFAVDEYTALVAEDVSTALVELVDERVGAWSDDASPLTSVRDVVAEMAVGHYHYRRARAYPSYVLEDDENEAFPYRRRILKRIVSSALYLDIRHEEAGRITRDLIGMVAAAAAMLFAVLVGIWAQLAYGVFSMPFIVAAVISYMIKDRIKEWGKRYLGRRFARWVPDHVIQILDAEGRRVIGRCAEACRVVDPHRLDPEIQRLRHIDHPSTVAEDGRPEVVVHYSKEITLESEALGEHLDGLEGLNDIIRFNVSRLRERMDAPYETYRLVHPETWELVSVPCARVYHVNFVLRLTSGRGRDRQVETERVRLIVDQRGIKRVELVDATSQATAPVLAPEPLREPLLAPSDAAVDPSTRPAPAPELQDRSAGAK